jgi:hypothetical protein
LILEYFLKKQEKEQNDIKISRVYKLWGMALSQFGSLAEWSKAVDLSPTISGCAGSNPAVTNTVK